VVEEEHILRVPEERLLQKVLQPERQEVTRDFRKMRNEELQENCARLGYYAASSVTSCGRFETTFWILDP
jgi:hypothetical protein